MKFNPRVQLRPPHVGNSTATDDSKKQTVKDNAPKAKEAPGPAKPLSVIDSYRTNNPPAELASWKRGSPRAPSKKKYNTNQRETEHLNHGKPQ